MGMVVRATKVPRNKSTARGAKTTRDGHEPTS